MTGEWTLQAYRFALNPAPAQAEAPAAACGADRKTPTPVGAGGDEAATRTGDAHRAAGGTATPKGEAA